MQSARYDVYAAIILFCARVPSLMPAARDTRDAYARYARRHVYAELCASDAYALRHLRRISFSLFSMATPVTARLMEFI